MIPPQIYWKCSLSFYDKCSLKGLPYVKQLKRTLYIYKIHISEFEIHLHILRCSQKRNNNTFQKIADVNNHYISLLYHYYIKVAKPIKGYRWGCSWGYEWVYFTMLQAHISTYGPHQPVVVPVKYPSPAPRPTIQSTLRIPTIVAGKIPMISPQINQVQ